MKVYVVVHELAYDGYEIKAIHKTPKGAAKKLKVLGNPKEGWKLKNNSYEKGSRFSPEILEIQEYELED